IQHTRLQYVATDAYQGSPRYLFAELHQKTLSFTFRLNYTITPELTIEYYGQPFVSGGKYTHYKFITNTHAARFNDRYQVLPDNNVTYDLVSNNVNFDENMDGSTDYSATNPNFNFRQFLSNLVVRWEYLPGSTLFLVWSQGRTSTTYDGTFSYGDDMKGLFGTMPHNVFLLKFSYWFSL
ncbi:MAG TPA: DUF5916 domain-containing protein, partial [Bacteroidales bacterium]